MPPETRPATSPVKALSAKPTARVGESLKTTRAQAKPKSSATPKNTAKRAPAPRTAIETAKRTAANAAKLVSRSVTSNRKQSALEGSAVNEADTTDIGNTRETDTREKKAKGIVAKDNSAKTSETILTAAEAPASGEARVASKSASGVKTSAAAFFAARQRMTPAKAVAKPTSAAQVPDGSVSNTSRSGADMLDQNVTTANVDRIVAEPAPTSQAEGVRPTVGADKPPVAKAPAKASAVKGQGFKTHEFIVYPAHGVGQITAIEEQEVAGYKLELFVISFVKDKMILKVPLPKIASVGMRKLAEPAVVKRALDTLMGRARVKRTMWSRRAQEYEAKINSGDLVAIAEVVRDLYRSDAQPEQSYSERQLYEAALDRMAREIAAVQKVSDPEALKLIDDQLQKGPRRTKVEETEAEDGDDAEETGIVEAA